jgi:hypothetical protein
LGGSINTSLLRQLGVDQQILNQMIEEQVALIEADRNGIRVTDDELAQQILSLPGLQENGQFIGEARYQQLLQSQNPADDRQPVRRGSAPQSSSSTSFAARSPTGWPCPTAISSASTRSATRR